MGVITCYDMPAGPVPEREVKVVNNPAVPNNLGSVCFIKILES